MISKSIYQNNIPPLVFKHAIKNIYHSKNYIIVETNESLELFNIEFIPLKLMNLDLNKGF